MNLATNISFGSYGKKAMLVKQPPTSPVDTTKIPTPQAVEQLEKPTPQGWKNIARVQHNIPLSNPSELLTTHQIPKETTSKFISRLLKTLN